MHRFAIDLSDVDRGVYEQLDLRVAQHPSESVRRMVARVLAYCLRYEEGIAFGRGVSSAEEPALWVKDLRGDVTLWVDVGLPAPERLHRAMKSVGRVVVYAHKDPTPWLREVDRATIHKKDALEIWSFPAELLEAFEAGVSRNTKLSLTVTDGLLYLDIAGASVSGAPVRHVLD
ncbi:MAG: hypothetical protein DRJ42_28560 [Deltaproteobacteria bacterium]|nr:MAG: hypothetical protein DRJ42_28560 [Deltaproteobacteria bacterium]